MNFRKEVNLNLPDAEGEVKVIFSPLTFNVYQDGKKVKKKGGFRAKFSIKTKSGEVAPMLIRNTKGMVRTAFFNEQQIPLEEKVSFVEQLIAILSVTIVFFAAFFLFRFIIVGGVIGGALIGATVGMAVVFNLAFIRQEKSLVLKALVSLGISVVAFIIYLLVAELLAMLVFTAVTPFYY